MLKVFRVFTSSEEAETLARDLGMRLYRISVKDNLNIHGVFLHLAENYVSQVIQSNLFFHREFMGQANGHGGGAFTRLGSANSDSSSSGVSCSSSDSSRSSSGSVRSSKQNIFVLPTIILFAICRRARNHQLQLPICNN